MPGLEQYAGQTRPAHVHFMVMHPLFGPLTMQLYFKGDPYLSKDPFAKPSLAIDLESQATGGGKRLLGKSTSSWPGRSTLPRSPNVRGARNVMA